ncbi:MAG: radical SAM protein [Candidatus Accumulibacter sp. UW25]
MSDQLPQLRVTVNARCGRACFFCRPSGEALPTDSRQELDPDDLILIAKEFVRHGIRSIKLTGGDPALWPPLVDVVRRLRHEAGFQEVHVISRHPKIGELASDLAAAGATLINISVDTLRPELHREITGIDDLSDILAATHRAVASKAIVKVNTVVMAGINEHEVEDLVHYCERIGVRELKLLDVIQDLDSGFETFSRRLTIHRGGRLRDLYATLDPTVDRLRVRAHSEQILNQGGLGHPLLALYLPSGLQITVKDHRAGAWYGSICKTCSHFPCHDALMALRLTADLRLQFCLLQADAAVDLKPVLRRGARALEDQIDHALEVYRSACFFESNRLHKNCITFCKEERYD